MDRLWRMSLSLFMVGNCGQRGGQHQPTQRRWNEAVLCCQLLLLPVRVGLRCRRLQVPVEDGRSVGFCLSTHNWLPHRMFAQEVYQHILCEHLLDCDIFPAPPAFPDHEQVLAWTTTSSRAPDIYHHGPCGFTMQEPVCVATVGFSLPGGKRNDRVHGCALYHCAASNPQCEHSFDQDCRDSVGAVHQIFGGFFTGKDKRHVPLSWWNSCIKPDWREPKAAADWRLFETGSPH